MTEPRQRSPSEHSLRFVARGYALIPPHELPAE